jgi:hypothetical protein
MKRQIIATLAALALGAATGASAQSTTATTSGTAPTTSAASQTALTLDSPIEQIAANPGGKAILDKDIPGLTTHPAYEQFKSHTLKELQPMSNGQITDDGLQRVAADLAKLH